jgi:hypothetical protein
MIETWQRYSFPNDVKKTTKKKRRKTELLRYGYGTSLMSVLLSFLLSASSFGWYHWNQCLICRNTYRTVKTCSKQFIPKYCTVPTAPVYIFLFFEFWLINTLFRCLNVYIGFKEVSSIHFSIPTKWCRQTNFHTPKLNPSLSRL